MLYPLISSCSKADFTSRERECCLVGTLAVHRSDQEEAHWPVDNIKRVRQIKLDIPSQYQDEVFRSDVCRSLCFVKLQRYEHVRTRPQATHAADPLSSRATDLQVPGRCPVLCGARMATVPMIASTRSPAATVSPRLHCGRDLKRLRSSSVEIMCSNR